MAPQIHFLGQTYSSYLLMAAVGGVVSFFVLAKIQKKRSVNPRSLFFMIVWMLAGMFVGGNLLYNLVGIRQIVQAFSQAEQYGGVFGVILRLFSGSVFYGGLIGALAAAWIYLRKKKQKIGEYFDLLAVILPLFHGFGRIGCFFAGCCYGKECRLGFVFQNGIGAGGNGVSRFPVQLLEAGLCFVLFAALLRLFLKNRFRNHLLSVYLGLYSVIRFLLEYLRGDGYRGIYGPFSTSQWIGIAILLSLAVYYIRRPLRPPDK